MLTEQELMTRGYHNKNHLSGRYYKGEKNQIALNLAGYSTPEWLTFNQIRKNGYKLRKGSEGVEVVYSETTEVKEVEPDGTVTVKTIPNLVKHVVFNIDCCDKVGEPKQQEGSTFSIGKQHNSYNFMESSDKNQQNIYDSSMVTQKQRLFLIKLIESKYNDEKTKAGLLNRINELSKSEAKVAIKRMLTEI